MFLKDIIYPNICVCCDRLIPMNKYSSDIHICKECLSFCRSYINTENICKICSKDLDKDNEIEISNNICSVCYNNEQSYYFNRVVSVIKYNELFRDMLKDFKFNYNINVANVFVKILEEYILDNKEYFYDFDIISSVPMYKDRFKQRGFNQSSLIGKGICSLLGVDFTDNLLVKNFHTHAQSTLNAEERRKNILNIFTLNNEYDVVNKKILLIDDVFTTGSTLNECANVLVKNNCFKLECFCILKAR